MKVKHRGDNVDALIGGNVKKFREMLGMERKELAALFHITDDALYRIEKGQTGLSGIYGYILANRLNCDMNFIFGKNSVPQLIDTEAADEDHRKTMARVLRYFADLLEEQEERS